MKPTQKWYICTKEFPGVEEGTTFRTVEAHITTAFLLKEDNDHVIHETYAQDHSEYFTQYDPETKEKTKKENNIKRFTEKLVTLCDEHKVAIFAKALDGENDVTITYANSVGPTIIKKLVLWLLTIETIAEQVAKEIMEEMAKDE